MASSYLIGDIKRLLKVEAHVLRYWEKEIEFIQPRKDRRGRRVYSGQDLRVLLRLKYLLYEKRFTLSGAREQLFRELSGDYQDLRAQIAALRADLIDMFFVMHK
ncbi:MAG: MerR family transcriptional regulator [Treponema sp.]|nr:MerR family transcriptional regulator [Treponema sp.]